MSRNFAVLEKSVATAPAPGRASPERAPLERGKTSAASSPQYSELIRRLFCDCSVVAVVSSGFDGVAGVCDSIACELAVSGRRTVVVSAGRVLNMSTAELGAETTIMPGSAPNIWHWPSPPDRPIDFFRSHYPAKMDPGKWLDFLRQNFDCILLDCPPLEMQKPEEADSTAAIAAAADAAVLVVEAGQTPKYQIRHDQRALQSGGVKLRGCILIRRGNSSHAISI
jgi:Mrp family chromosome partitioning ATPase